MNLKVSLKNSRSIILKVQNLVSTTPGVERIHVICIDCPKNMEIQVKCPKKLSKVGFFEEKIQNSLKNSIPHSWLVIGFANPNAK